MFKSQTLQNPVNGAVSSGCHYPALSSPALAGQPTQTSEPVAQNTMETGKSEKERWTKKSFCKNKQCLSLSLAFGQSETDWRFILQFNALCDNLGLI